MDRHGHMSLQYYFHSIEEGEGYILSIIQRKIHTAGFSIFRMDARLNWQHLVVVDRP
jgi:hypothetical protein